MFSVYANIGGEMSDEDEWQIDTGRFLRVIEEQGHESVRDFEVARLPTWLRNKIGTYAKGKSRARSSVFAMVCGALGVSPLYLYGQSEEACRRYTLRLVGREFGADGAELLEALINLGPERRAEVVRVLRAMMPHSAPIVTEPVDVDAAAISRFAEDAAESQGSPTTTKRPSSRKRSSR